MPPLRRSTRRKRLKVSSMTEELQRCTIRYKKRRETLAPDVSRSSSSYRLRMISDILSNDANLQLHATTHLLKLLSVEDEPPIDEVIKSGAIPRLVEFLQMDSYPQLQHVAARVLKNITTGTSENTRAVIDHGAIPLLVKLLDSPNDQVREQLVSAISVLESLILFDDEAVLTEACWALSYLCRDCGKERPDMLSSILSRTDNLLMHPSRSVVLPAIRTVVSILHGDVSLIEVCDALVPS